MLLLTIYKKQMTLLLHEMLLIKFQVSTSWCGGRLAKTCKNIGVDLMMEYATFLDLNSKAKYIADRASENELLLLVLL